MKNIKSVLLLLLVPGLLSFFGCAKKGQSANKRFFKLKDHAISFKVPKGFKKIKRGKVWGTHQWQTKDKKLTIAFKAVWNPDLKFFSLERTVDLYFSAHRLRNPESTLYLESTRKFPLGDIPSIYFKGIDGDKAIGGVLAVANNRMYTVRISGKAADINSDQAKDLFQSLVNSLKLKKLPDNKKYLRKILEKQAMEGETDVKRILDYGQQLMKTKEDYAKNYPLAISEYRKALQIMENLSDRPHYNRALRLIMIAKELQKNAYDKHKKSFVKAVMEKRWKNAREEARIMVLLTEDDPENPLAKRAKKDFSFASSRIKKR